jgi:hypothetical protein
MTTTWDLRSSRSIENSAVNVKALYESLPLPDASSTRILRILPVQPSDVPKTIVCEMTVISLDPPPKYNAVSYVWGQDDPSSSHNVSINGTLMPVRPNIWHFLEQMRKETFEDLLWIDAICINQRDIAERGHQVAVMGQIYEKAAEVQAWLGDANEPVQQAMRMICACWSERSSSKGERSGNDGEAVNGDLGTNDAEQTTKRNVGGQVSANTGPGRILSLDDLTLISHIWSCVYWSRLWIVPEFLLAKELTIRCGSVRMPTKVLELFVGMTIPNRYRAPDKRPDRVSGLSQELGPKIVFARAKRCWERYMEHDTSLQLWSTKLSEIIARIGNGDCADERDRIYAFLPLDKKALKMIKPDYSKTTSQVFEELYDAQMLSNSAQMRSNSALEQSALPFHYEMLQLSHVAGLLGLDARGDELYTELRSYRRSRRSRRLASTRLASSSRDRT